MKCWLMYWRSWLLMKRDCAHFVREAVMETKLFGTDLREC